MIRVSLTVLVFIYLAIMLGLIFAAWLASEWRRQRRERLAFRNVLRCALCSAEFADFTSEPTPACPRCHSRNERTRYARL